jgi:hypothetical protein
MQIATKPNYSFCPVLNEDPEIPQGGWLWPAIWMMPVTDTYGAWPARSEIAIMGSRSNNY